MVVQSPIRHSRNRKSRGRGLRTTSGCLTCRKRHIKCDEAKPICGPCMRNSKHCDYTPSSTVSTAVTARTAPRDTANRLSIHQPSEADESAEDAPAGQYINEDHDTCRLAVHPDADAIFPPQSHLDHLSGSISTSHHSPNTTRSNPISPPDGSYASYSANSASIPSPEPTVNAAAIRWFGLLVSDAARESSQLSTALIGYNHDYDYSAHPEDGSDIPLSSLQRATQVLDHDNFSGGVSRDALDVDGGTGISDLSSLRREERIWKAQKPIELLSREAVLFEHFIQRVSQSIDLFDPTSQFSNLVPHLAVRNAGLMNAILALSCRHLTLNPRLDSDDQPDPEAGLQYYYQTLHYVQKAMQYASYKTSLELLATTLIISTYEMFDSSSNDWERHLEGVFLIQRSQVIHGESGGLYAAVWWAWLCQDIWAAFREKRRTLTFWIPQKPLDSLLPHELAARSLYITAKVVNFCSQERRKFDRGVKATIDKANELRAMLDDWQRYLTIEFSPLPCVARDPLGEFRPKYIRPPAFAVAIQFHCVSRILLLSHEPSLGGFSDYCQREIIIKRCIEMIGGIAMTLQDEASSLMSSQALFIGGMFTHDSGAREAILELLERCRQRTGWPVKSLGDELQRLWDMHEPSDPSDLMTSFFGA